MIISEKNEESIHVSAQLDRAPLSFAQQRIWLIHQLEQNSTEYNMLWAQRMRGKLDVGALSKAINTIVQRHEPLRTCIAEFDGEPMQWVDPPKDINIPIDDLTHLDTAAQQERIRGALRKDGNEPIDLRKGPMLRFRLLRLGENDHVFLRVMHHINYDGWSDGLFCKELNALYDGFSEGRLEQLVPLPSTYKEFAVSQRKSVAETVNTGLPYWRKQLAGIPEQLELPADRPYGTMATLGSGLHYVGLSAEQIAGVRRLSQANGATFFMTMLSVFAVLLHRYCGQNDIVVGTPIANRRSPVLENIIGCFVNALPLRIRLKTGMTFRELLKNVRDTAWDAYQHQDVPFERIVEELAPRRSSSRTPLFQVSFSMQDTPSTPLRLRGLDVEPPFRGERLRSRFDLELQVSPREGEPTLCWSYKRDLFDDWRIQQMARNYVTLIDAIIADPDRELSDLDPLSSADRAMLLEQFNDTQHDLPEVTLPALFEQRVQQAPDSVAIIFHEAVVTYRELNDRANRIADHLIARGIGCEDIVAIAMDRTPDLVVAILGTMKCGAAFLPLDPDYPPARLAHMLSDAQPKYLLTTVAAQSKLPETAYDQLIVDSNDALRIQAEGPAHDPANAERVRPLGKTNAVYVIYTSGSTGKPKGAVGTQIGFVNRLLWFNGSCASNPEQQVLSRISVGWIDGLTELFAPLVHGAPVVFADSASAKTPSALIDLINRWQIGRITLVPSLLRALLDEPNAGQLQSCKLWVSASETLLGSDAKRLWATVPEARLLNLYGCSESCGDSVFATCESSDIVVGKPIWNTQVYILSEDLQPTPIGVPGEVYFAGEGVARGYWRRPELTSERFIADPYGPSGSRMYRTGDIGRWRQDGNLELLGRVDRQVKVRGHRIESAEIEAALREQSSVRDAVIVPRTDESGETRLIAYVVPSATQGLNTYDLRRQLMLVMPDYMIPTSFQALDSLPTLANGKLDVKGLPPPVVLPKTFSRTPRTEREEILCSLFAELLRVDGVGIDDDFFELGGHSLLATSLINRIRQAFGVELTLRAILEAGTVASISEQWP